MVHRSKMTMGQPQRSLWSGPLCFGVVDQASLHIHMNKYGRPVGGGVTFLLIYAKKTYNRVMSSSFSKKCSFVCRESCTRTVLEKKPLFIVMWT